MSEKKGGRKPKIDKQSAILTIRLNEKERTELLNLADKCGQNNISKFVRSCIFNREISVVTIDNSLYKIIEWLTKIHSQYRAIGVNYNQTVKHINTCFGENKAVLLLKNLEKYTADLIKISEQIRIISEKLKEKYDNNEN